MNRLSFRPVGWLSSSPPTVGIAFSATRLSAIAVQCRDGGVTVTAHASVDLAPGVLTPSLTAKNVLRPEALDAAVTQLLGRLPGRAKRVAVALPDAVAKVSLVRFDTVPPRAADFDQLVKWQMRKSAPFPMEEAQLAYAPALTTAEGGREFLVSVARRDVVLEYERACASAGAHAGCIDIAAIGLIDAVVVGDRIAGHPPDRDWLLVHLSSGWCTLAIVRHEAVIFFRSRALEGEENFADMVHQTAMYYEDRLGGAGFARVVVADATGAFDPAAQQDLEARLQTTAQPLDPRMAAAMAERGSMPADVLAGLAAPLGVTLREWVA